MNKPHARQVLKKGFGLVEILVGSAVLSVALLSISNFFQTTLRASRATESVVQGDYLLEEGIEVVKLFRDTNYTNNLRNRTMGIPYYFSWNSGASTWEVSTVNTFIDGKFERKFVLENVNRDGNNDIAVSGTMDPNVKLVTVSVSWWSPAVGTTTRSIQTYVTNIANN